MNDSLQEEIHEKEVLTILSSFQKGKIPGPDGLTVEFSLDFFYLLK
jgi:hypothetical protein